MRTFMQARNISAGALAVTRNQRLVLSRGYTYRSTVTHPIVQPTSRFRIASLSKPLTATAILRLVQEGRLSLSARLIDLLPLAPPTGRTPDPRLGQITIRRLLQHLGGWNRDLINFDPMFNDRSIAQALRTKLPIKPNHITKYMTGQPLQHTPGTAYAYSNYGYLLLGQVIAKVSGQTYARYIKDRLLTPLQMRSVSLGRTLPSQRYSDEVPYSSQYRGATVMNQKGAIVASPDGTFNLENMAAHGGWLASAADLVRFAAAFDQPATSPILTAPSIAAMFGLPEHIAPSQYSPGGWYYGCGWEVRDWGNGRRNTWHTGSLPGTHTLLVRRYDGLNWCVLFNQRDDPSNLSYPAIDNLLHSAADSVRQWPSEDLTAENLAEEVEDSNLDTDLSDLDSEELQLDSYQHYLPLVAN